MSAIIAAGKESKWRQASRKPKAEDESSVVAVWFRPRGRNELWSQRAVAGAGTTGCRDGRGSRGVPLLQAAGGLPPSPATPPAWAWGRLYAPDQEIGERAYFLAYEIGIFPIGSCSPDRAFNLFSEFVGDSVVVFVRRCESRR